MNELAFLRGQLRLERSHYGQQLDLLARSLRSPAGEPGVDRTVRAAAAYVLFATRRTVQRNHLHARRLASRLAATELAADERGAIGAASQRLVAVTAATQAALDALAAAMAVDACATDTAALRDACAAFAGPVPAEVMAAAETLEPWFERLYDLADWRSVALTDAESVFEERCLHDAAFHAAGEAGLRT